MSDEEFVARWFRRKREARAGNDAPEPAEPMEARAPAPSVGTGEAPPTPDVDLSSLPPIDSIDAATDITTSLRKGIPRELSRAALRRAWTADPVIRDFVGLAENAWDFNDPNAMPGFGPLDRSEAELSALADRVVGGVRQGAESLPNTLAEAEDIGQLAAAERDPGQEPKPMEAMEDLSASDATTAESRPDSVALQPKVAEQVDSEHTSARRRTHGGALPR
jgi:hypothetical protein